MSPAGFEPTIPASVRPQTDVLDTRPPESAAWNTKKNKEKAEEYLLMGHNTSLGDRFLIFCHWLTGSRFEEK